MKKRRSSQTRLAPLADINLTSMIDVIFFMLILFLLVSPIVEYGINVNLPETSAKKIAEPESLTVNVKNVEGSSRVYLDNERVTMEELETRLKAIASRAPEPTLILRADKDLSYNSVMEVIDRITDAGIARMGMATVAKPER